MTRAKPGSGVTAGAASSAGASVGAASAASSVGAGVASSAGASVGAASTASSAGASVGAASAASSTGAGVASSAGASVGAASAASSVGAGVASSAGASVGAASVASSVGAGVASSAAASVAAGGALLTVASVIGPCTVTKLADTQPLPPGARGISSWIHRPSLLRPMTGNCSPSRMPVTTSALSLGSARTRSDRAVTVAMACSPTMADASSTGWPASALIMPSAVIGWQPASSATISNRPIITTTCFSFISNSSMYVSVRPLPIPQKTGDCRPDMPDAGIYPVTDLAHHSGRADQNISIIP